MNDPTPGRWISRLARREARLVMAEHEHRHHGGDPPSPVPDWLRPLRGHLGADDLRIAPSTQELRVIAQVLEHEQLAGQALVTMRDGSPWLELDVAVPGYVHPPDHVKLTAEAAAPSAVYRYAIWRYTCRAYRVGPDGAVEDDPLELPEETAP